MLLNHPLFWTETVAEEMHSYVICQNKMYGYFPWEVPKRDFGECA